MVAPAFASRLGRLSSNVHNSVMYLVVFRVPKNRAKNEFDLLLRRLLEIEKHLYQLGTSYGQLFYLLRVNVVELFSVSNKNV